MDANLSVENLEAVEELVWTLNASRGEFSLVIVRCNYSVLRDRAIETLREQVENVVLWVVPAKTTALLEGVREQATAEMAAVMVVGLEGVQELEELLSATNRIREEFRSGCPFPVVLWVTDAGLRSLIRSAPDFESWGTTTQLIWPISEVAEYIQQEAEQWFARERYADLPGDGGFAAVESELKVSRADLERHSSLTHELEAQLEVLLGECCKRQNQYKSAAEHFIRALGVLEFVDRPKRKAKVLLEIVFSQYFVAYGHDRNHADWQAVESYLNQYLDCCKLYAPDFPLRSMPDLGKVLKELEYWELLQDLAQQRLRSDRPESYVAPYHGFLAEVALVECRWKDAGDCARKALEQANHYCQLADQEAIRQFRFFKVKVDLAWYQLLLGRSMQQLNQSVEAIERLEDAAQILNDYSSSDLQRQVLMTLQSLYSSQGEYWKAFEAKQELSFVEQQMGIRAFVGAGRFRQLSRNAQKNWGELGSQFSSEFGLFGRSKDIKELVSRIASTEFKLTVLHGVSGVGKSSLVEGGLVPALKGKAIGSRDNRIVVVRQYRNWVAEIWKTLRHDIKEEQIDIYDPSLILESLKHNDQQNLRSILIFDQFEEFFFVQPLIVNRQMFYRFLGECFSLSNVKVVFSIREDYLDYLQECIQVKGFDLIDDISGDSIRYGIGNFSSERARSIIHNLTDQSQFTLELALLDRLVEDLAEPLGEVRPIELQIVGAQLQTEGIRKLADYPSGGKDELVDQYLMATIRDCGKENEELAELVGYLLTDSQGMRPSKTRDELMKRMDELKRTPSPEQLELVLAVLVGSGLVMRLKESPDDRYQLVHDYLAGVIRKRKKAKRFVRLEQRLEEEREKNRKLLEKNVQIQRKVKLGKWVLGGITAASIAVVTFASQFVFNANQKENAANDRERQASGKVESAETRLKQLTAQTKEAEAKAKEKEKQAQAQVGKARAEEKKAKEGVKVANQQVALATQKRQEAELLKAQAERQAAEAATQAIEAKGDREMALQAARVLVPYSMCLRSLRILS